MTYKNTPNSYGSVAKFFHWIIFLLVLGLLIVGTTMIYLSDKNLFKPTIYNLHKLTGLTVLTLMVLRLIWLSLNKKPLLPFNIPRWEKVAERIVVVLFYILLFTMPLSGWVMDTALGYPPKLGHYALNMPGIAKNKQLGDFAGNIHEYVAWILAILIFLHVAAALKHHFYDKDNVLKTMWPKRLRLRSDLSDR